MCVYPRGTRTSVFYLYLAVSLVFRSCRLVPSIYHRRPTESAEPDRAASRSFDRESQSLRSFPFYLFPMYTHAIFGFATEQSKRARATDEWQRYRPTALSIFAVSRFDRHSCTGNGVRLRLYYTRSSLPLGVYEVRPAPWKNGATMLRVARRFYYDTFGRSSVRWGPASRD